MLTQSQPATHYGYRSVHDLPTPPSTSRFSPPLALREVRKHFPAIPRRSSPPNQPMSAPHRGLPPPAAMPLSQPSHQSSGPPPPPLHPLPSGPSAGQSHHPPPFSPPQQAQVYAQFPPAPSWQHVSEETMRAYLAAKGEEEKRRQEEEKRRQEEEKTRQATLLLDQRRMEHDILQSSLQGGIPPPMVPFVFAGMGGGVLPQAAIEWAHQYLYSQSQQPQAAALLLPGQISASPRRESQAQGYGQYAGSAGVPSTPGSAQGHPSWYPGSPTRPRGQSMSGPWPPRQPTSSSQNLPSLNTTFPARAGGDGAPAQPGVSSAQQQEQTPSIFFHHWQPPNQSSGRGSGTDQPGAPSGPSPKKRKTSDSQPTPPAPSGGNSHQSAALSNPPPGRRRGHSRQRSDLGPYGTYPGRLERNEGYGQPAVSSAYGPGSGVLRESAAEASSSSSRPQPQTQRSGTHSVSSLLADNPSSPQSTQYPPRITQDMPASLGGDGRRGSPDETARGGASQTKRERQNND